MKQKHLEIRIRQCFELAKASNCPRRKFGAMILDPVRNVVLMDGYNGAPRGGDELCGGETCARSDLKILTGSHAEIGCHHAEMNAICNCAASGVATKGAWLIVTGEPCLMCAKLIHHAGIVRVISVGGAYPDARGAQYLVVNGVAFEEYENA